MAPSTSDRRRARKAFRILNRILFSYLSLFIATKIFGQTYYKRKIQNRHLKNADRAKKAIFELQGLFTKVGQLMSMMSNILPKAYADVLETLQDQAPAQPFENVKETIEKDLGEPLDQLFDSFETEPIASASIGQVHKAQLHSGAGCG